MSGLGAINGNFAPESALSAFDGQNGNGVWILNVSDRAAIDIGSVRGFTLEFACNGNTPICNGNIVRIDANAAPPATQSFTNLNNTHIPAGGPTVLLPYPVTLAAICQQQVFVKSVTLTNFSHSFPDDVDIVLVSPTDNP
jgi:subtilisin-like proprotein convertase family protein